MRDAQQSLMATRMRTKDLAGAARATNAFMQNAYSVESGAVPHSIPLIVS